MPSRTGKTKRTLFFLSPEDKKRLITYCFDNDITQQDFIESAVVGKLTKENPTSD